MGGDHASDGARNRNAAAPIRRKQITQGGACRRILIVGAGPHGRALALELETHFPGEYQVVGFVEDEPLTRSETEGCVLGGREEIADLVGRYAIDEVIPTEFLSGRLGGVSCPAPAASGARDRRAMGNHRGASDTTRAVTEPAGLPREGPSAWYPALKRGGDILFALIALILGAPVAALAAVAIKLTSRGPVFYRQERVGCAGRPFTIFKLRTMIDGAESDTGPTLARCGDPRSTPLGRFLRGVKLDEWPQFYNVLRGDMSVVGPRPERPFFVQAYDRHIRGYSHRHTVRPGITGLAQISGGYLTHVYVKLHYDLVYIRNQSLWLDLGIVLQTPIAIWRNLRARG
jgi:lipopolysaccharide/colanic/teichoic acid biosynthesis glycosyltransferase